MAYQLSAFDYKDKPYNEVQNYGAFAVIKNDGSVVAWGGADFGGANAPSIENVKQIFSTGYAFAALKNDGSVVSWGTDGNDVSFSQTVEGVKTISSTESAFAALKNDGSVVAWGNSENGGTINSLTNVTKIYSNNYAFVALQNDGNIVVWGDKNKGGDITTISGLDDISKIFSTRDAFAALKNDGSVVVWGSGESGGNTSDEEVTTKLSDSNNKVVNIYATDGAFAALREDGSVVTWGESTGGGYSDAVSAELNNSSNKVIKLFTNSTSFAALREDGSVVTWGGEDAGYVVDGISGNNQLPIFATHYAFAALKNNGSVVTWGDVYSGGEISVSVFDYNTYEWTRVPLASDVLVDVNKIYSNGSAFAALRADGSVVTWGDNLSGGDSSTIATNLNGDIDVKQIFTTGLGTFAALRADGSVITWGDSTAVSSLSIQNVVSFANAATDDIVVRHEDPQPQPQPVVITNYPPSGTVSISGAPTQAQTLTVSNSLDDANGLGEIHYQWLSDGSVIANATKITYTLTQADVGKTISVKASYSDGAGYVENILSASTPLVANVNDAPTGNVVIEGVSKQNAILTASNTLVDADGLGVIVYHWLRNDLEIAGATNATYTLTQDDVAQRLSVKATYIDLFGSAEGVTSLPTEKIANVNDLPTGNLSILGKATQNETLTVSAETLADVDGLGERTYHWLRNGLEIPNATGAIYVLTQDDVNQRVSVKGRYTDKFGTAESVTSAPTQNIVNVNDAPMGNTRISGVFEENHVLTAENNLSDTDGLGDIHYQWLRNAVIVADATQSTYRLTQDDVGAIISVKASYTDGFDTQESAVSADSPYIINENDTPDGAVSIDGVARKGYVLTVSNTLTDKDGLGEIHYQWLNDGDVIAGANQATYSLRQTDAGKHISVKASYIDEQNTQESMASQEMLIAENKAPTGKVIMKGTPLYGATLSVSNTIKDADGLGKLSYLWENDAGILSTSPRYTLIKNDIDTKLWVTAYYTDKQGNREEVKSAVVDVAVSTTSSVFNDRLEGNANANKLSGLGGNDTLIGGAGSDKLTGGSGADTFVFKKADFFSQNHTGALIFNQSVDTITDFHVKEHDILDFQEMGELHFYPSMSAAQDDHSAFLFYVKNVGKIYVNMSNTGDFTPINIIVLSGKPAINSDFIDWNVPTT